jgi:Zn-dependent protease
VHSVEIQEREKATVMAWTDLTLQLLVLRLVAYVFVAAVHGFTIAAVAVALGDQGPRYDGRRSINPLAHLDLIGTASGVLFSVGWITPVAVDPFALRPGRIGLAIVVAAGFAATLVSAMALRLARPFILPLLPDTASATVFALIEITGELSVWFALINILPLPPLTGAHLLAVAAPAYGKALAGIAPYAGLALALVAATGIVTRLLRPVYRALATLILGGA